MATKKKAVTKKKAAKRQPVAKKDISLRKLGYDRKQIAAFQEECEALGIDATKMFFVDLNARWHRLRDELGKLEVSQAHGMGGHVTSSYGDRETESYADRNRQYAEKIAEERRDLSNLMTKVMGYVIPQKRAVEADVRAQVVSLVDVLKQVADD